MGERKPKYKHIERQQYMWLDIAVDELIGQEHPARLIWELTGKLDLSAFETDVRSFEGGDGSPLWSARLLVSLWLYAYQQGISSARELERRMQWEPGLRWLAGCEVINHHTLSTFRAVRKAGLDALLEQLLVVLAEEQLVDFRTVVHDGTKIQARAGRSSARSRAAIKAKLAEARSYMERIDRIPEGEQRSRKQAAGERAARERVERLQAALEEIERGSGEEDKVRVSITEPEARRMKHTEHGGTCRATMCSYRRKPGIVSLWASV